MVQKSPRKSAKPADVPASHPKAVAPSISASAVLESVNCPEGIAAKTDMIELFEAEGDLQRTFPDLYRQVNAVITRTKAGDLMDKGVRYVAVSTSGTDEKGGQVNLAPMHGNTGQLFGTMSEIREILKAQGLVVTLDANQPCSNFGGRSRGLRIDVPPRR